MERCLLRLRLTVGLLIGMLFVGCTSSTSSTGNDRGEVCALEVDAIAFGISSSESQQSLKQDWEPFLAAMADEVGRPVEGVYATDYAGVIEAMGVGKLHVAWYGGKAYIEAAERSGAEAFTRTVNTDGTQGYYSHLITFHENPILTEIDVAAGDGDTYVVEHASDLTFAFNDRNSTSGYLVPSLYVFAEKGLNSDNAFRELTFVGSHEATALAAANNQVDVATNNSETLAMLAQADPETRAKIQVIWTSPMIPTEPIAYHQDLPDCLKEQIKAFFYNYEDSEILEPLGWAEFVPAEDKDWNAIRELDIGKQILDVQNDESLDETAKQRQIEELNQQLEAL
ncbi:MAG: phosphonate ABC transporter substrate-binding protein [Cyanobacteria bacterium J06626_18]